jgi:hypothetical protein
MPAIGGKTHPDFLSVLIQPLPHLESIERRRTPQLKSMAVVSN